MALDIHPSVRWRDESVVEGPGKIRHDPSNFKLKIVADYG